MDMADLEAQLQAADAAGAKVKLIATGGDLVEQCWTAVCSSAWHVLFGFRGCV
jgi:fructose-1,6-bisphosphatase/sedoheptulose 1,7-bisphosphatase-like protein